MTCDSGKGPTVFFFFFFVLRLEVPVRGSTVALASRRLLERSTRSGAASDAARAARDARRMTRDRSFDANAVGLGLVAPRGRPTSRRSATPRRRRGCVRAPPRELLSSVALGVAPRPRGVRTPGRASRDARVERRTRPSWMPAWMTRARRAPPGDVQYGCAERSKTGADPPVGLRVVELAGKPRCVRNRLLSCRRRARLQAGLRLGVANAQRRHSTRTERRVEQKLQVRTRALPLYASRPLSRATRARDARRVGDRRSSRSPTRPFFRPRARQAWEGRTPSAPCSPRRARRRRASRPSERGRNERASRRRVRPRGRPRGALSRFHSCHRKRAPLEPRLMGCPVSRRGAEDGRRRARVARRAHRRAVANAKREISRSPPLH